MSRYEDDYHSRGRRSSHSHSRDRDYAPYADDRQSYERESDTRQDIASPGYTTYNGAPPSSRPRLTYEPHSSHPSLQIPDDDSHPNLRPRSLPPLIEYHQHRSSPRDSSNRRRQHQHQRGYSGSSSSASDRAQTPIGRAKHFVDSTFTDSAAGIGVGVLGALVGGLAAREATSKFGNNDNGNSGGGGGGGNGKGHRRHYSDAAEQAHRRNQILGAVVGAAVGALGANAVEKKLERDRDREREKEKVEWERRWGKENEREKAGRGKRERRSVSRSRGRGGGEVIERREMITRVRSRSREESSGGSGGDGGRRMMKIRGGGGGGGSGRGIEREVDPGARSWKNVEDWLNDDRYCGGITDREERESEEGRLMRRAGGGGGGSGSGSWSER